MPVSHKSPLYMRQGAAAGKKNGQKNIQCRSSLWVKTPQEKYTLLITITSLGEQYPGQNFPPGKNNLGKSHWGVQYRKQNAL